jgi:hypothetical protein
MPAARVRSVHRSEGILGDGHVSSLVIHTLQSTGPWLRIAGIGTIVFAALSVLSGVISLFVMPLASSFAMPFVQVSVQLIVAAIMIRAGTHLLNTAKAGQRLVDRGSLVDLEDALGHQLLYWRIVGTMMLVGIGVVVLFVLVALAVMAM